jgi:hypothetical protein
MEIIKDSLIFDLTTGKTSWNFIQV